MSSRTPIRRWLMAVAALSLLGACQCGGSESPSSAPQPTSATSSSASAAAQQAPATAAASASSLPAATLSKPAWLGLPPFVSDDEVDAIIRGGEVIDGTGAAPTLADVVIDDGMLVHLGVVDEAVKAKRTIDASGLVVTPGFIDVHSHADPLHANRNLLAMGVTTAVVGQDGRSPSNDRIRYWANRVGKKRLAVNIAALVGHGTVRGLAKVGATREPSEKQIARMARIVAKELKAGAFGLSSGLEYQPGALASREELIGIAKPVAERDGVIMSHLRSEDDDAIDAALDELLAQGSEGGARVHVAHIKVVYGRGAARAEALLQKLAAARAAGLKVTADIYPYNASYTTISLLFPKWAKPPASFKRAKRERHDELRAFLRDKVARRGGPEATLFGTAPFTGRTLAQVADKKGKPFEDVLIDNIRPGGASAAYFVMDDALQARLLQDDKVMFGTDGGAHSRHPRGHGTFAKVLAEHVRKRKLLPLHQAIRKMSGLAADTLRLGRLKRGTLAIGHWADVLVFDPREVQDHASYEKPHRRSSGMRWVFVNGRLAIADGKFRKGRHGKLLKPAAQP